jgi:hypothetical protein
MKVIKKGETKNYGQFCMAIGNRIYKENQAAKLAQSIKENNMLGACPIICIHKQGRLEVIDGQHRLGACKILEIPVPYIVVDGVTAEDISRLNRDQKGWGSKDYLHHYCSLGKHEYMVLAAFLEKTKLPVTLAATLVSGRVQEGGGAGLDSFRMGTYKAKSVDFAWSVYGDLEKMKAAGCTFVCDRSLVKAIANIKTVYPDFDAERLIRRMRYMPLEKRANWIDYCIQIERLYNYRSQSCNIVHVMAMLQDAGLTKKD